MKFDAKFEQMSSNNKLDEIYSKFDCFLMKRIDGNASLFSSAPEFNLVILEWLMKMKLFKYGTFVDTKHTDTHILRKEASVRSVRCQLTTHIL